MKAAILVLAVLLILLIVVFVSIFIVFTVRVEEVDNRVNDWEVRINNLAEGLRLVNEQFREVDRERKNNILKERLINNSVSSEQVEEARKRAKL